MVLFLDLLKALFIGGIICSIGQILIDLTKATPAKILVGFVVAGVILGGIGLYEPIAEWAGAGASVPLTGFGNVLAKGTKEAVQQFGLRGVITGPLTAGSAGITAAVICGLIASLIAKPKEK